MEAPDEGRRLLAQEEANPSLRRLLDAGLATGLRVVDVGCGAGAVLPAILAVIGEGGALTAVEPNAARLAEARAVVGAAKNASFVQAGLPATGLPGASFDFVWSQFVFEYLADPGAALAECVRLARPGGKVVVSDIDSVGLGVWPVPEEIARGTGRFLAALARTGFDLEVGRKLFTLFRRAGLREIRVHLSPLYICAGAADQRLLDDWRQRFAVLEPIAGPMFEGPGAYARFCSAYLDLLADSDALKFATVLVTEGTR